MKLIDITYNRNGISGDSFFAVRFTDNGRSLVGIVFTTGGNYAVMNTDDPTLTYQGDQYIGQLSDWVKAYDKAGDYVA